MRSAETRVCAVHSDRAGVSCIVTGDSGGKRGFEGADLGH